MLVLKQTPLRVYYSHMWFFITAVILITTLVSPASSNSHLQTPPGPTPPVANKQIEGLVRGRLAPSDPSETKWEPGARRVFKRRSALTPISLCSAGLDD